MGFENARRKSLELSRGDLPLPVGEATEIKIGQKAANDSTEEGRMTPKEEVYALLHHYENLLLNKERLGLNDIRKINETDKKIGNLIADSDSEELRGLLVRLREVRAKALKGSTESVPEFMQRVESLKSPNEIIIQAVQLAIELSQKLEITEEDSERVRAALADMGGIRPSDEDMQITISEITDTLNELLRKTS